MYVHVVAEVNVKTEASVDKQSVSVGRLYVGYCPTCPLRPNIIKPAALLDT